MPKERARPLTVAALRQAGLDGFHPQGKGSELDARVLVRNRFARDDQEAGSGAGVYYSYRDAEPYDRLRIFDVLNVYDFARIGPEVWYFVGGERASPGRQVEQMLYGWVKAEEVIPWPSRVSLYYQPGKIGLRIYGNEADALADRNPIAFQDTNRTEPRERNIPRFPLLDSYQPEAGLTLHKIAFPGIACTDPERRETCIVEGYVLQPHDDPDFRYWLAIKPPDMNDIVQSSQVFCDTLSDVSPESDKLVKAMMETLKSVVGDVPRISGPEDETNIRLFLHKRLQVPVEQFSELLDKNLDGFVAWYKESPPEKTRVFKETTCRKAALLELARNGVRLKQGQDDLTYDPTTRRWQPKPGTAEEFNWIWGTEHGIHYYYIPLDYVF